MLTKETINKTRGKYLDFIRDWPASFRYKGKDFRELFTLRGELSLWWLSNMQMKDSEASRVFMELCLYEQGEKKACELELSARSRIWHLFSRLRYLVYMALKIIIFNLLVKKEKNRAKTSFLFTSLYGETLKEEQDLKDRYYLDIPRSIKIDLGENVKYISFYYGSIFKLIKQANQLPSEVIYYEKYLTIMDVFKALDMKNLIKYLVLEFQPIFRKSFVYDGFQVFNLFKEEMRSSYLGAGISELILLSKAAERIVCEKEARCVVSFLEMYPYSRALYYGVKKGRPRVQTIAYQHATITPNKVWNVFSPEEMALDGNHIKGMPIPDKFIFQGKMGKDIYVASGYPEERCFLTGSPRFDRLFNMQKSEIGIKFQENKPTILVTTAYMRDDAQKIVNMVMRVAGRRPDIFFVFKSHPHCPINYLLDGKGKGNCAVAADDVHQLILRAKALITSYSMTADEAIALGCPVISIQNDGMIDMSTFFAIEVGPRASSAAELGAALELVLNQAGEMERYKRNWPQLLEASFFRIDGKSRDRVLKVFENILAAGQIK